MSQTGVVSWSQTASSNGTADSSVSWPEGMAPSAINDSARNQMASTAKYRDDTAGSLKTGGTSTAYTLSTNQVFSTLSVLNGQELTVRFDQTNGANPTLNVDTLGAKALRVDATNAVPEGMIVADSIWRVTYDNSIPTFIVNCVAAPVFDDITVRDDATIEGDAAVTGAVTAATVTTTGDVTVGDGLAVTGDVAVNASKFTVAASTGDTAIAGTAVVTGVLTANNAAGIVGRNVAKAFAYFTVSGGTVSYTSSTQGFNVSTVTRNSTGSYTIAFSNALASANYAVNVTANALVVGHPSNQATTGFDIGFRRAATEGGTDPSSASFVVFGL